MNCLIGVLGAGKQDCGLATWYFGGIVGRRGWETSDTFEVAQNMETVS